MVLNAVVEQCTEKDVKLIIQVLGVLGLANMWAAVFADVGVSIIAIFNSLRLMRK